MHSAPGTAGRRGRWRRRRRCRDPGWEWPEHLRALEAAGHATRVRRGRSTPRQLDPLPWPRRWPGGSRRSGPRPRPPRRSTMKARLEGRAMPDRTARNPTSWPPPTIRCTEDGPAHERRRARHRSLGREVRRDGDRHDHRTADGEPMRLRHTPAATPTTRTEATFGPRREGGGAPPGRRWQSSDRGSPMPRLDRRRAPLSGPPGRAHPRMGPHDGARGRDPAPRL